jgi:carotenoid cleavage dioxygenase-like enzyme
MGGGGAPKRRAPAPLAALLGCQGMDAALLAARTTHFGPGPHAAAPPPRPHAGEPLFVPAPGAAAEDDGVILAPGAAPDGAAFVAVLDAATMAELGRAEMPFSTPYRFHGIWLDGQQ